MAIALCNKFGISTFGAVFGFWSAGLEVAGAHSMQSRAALTRFSVRLTKEGVCWTRRRGDLRTGCILASRFPCESERERKKDNREHFQSTNHTVKQLTKSNLKASIILYIYI